MSVITKYFNNNAQTPLGDLCICYTSKFATNTVTSRTDGALALVYATPASFIAASSSVDRRRCDNQ